MDNQGKNAMSGTQLKKIIGLPITSLGLSLVPVVLIFLSILRVEIPAFYILVGVLSPIAGLIIGIACLCQDKKRLGRLGKSFSILGISLPASLILFILLAFIGVTTGIVPIM